MKQLSRWLCSHQLPLLIFLIGFTNNLAPTFVLHFRDNNTVPFWQVMLLQSLFFISYFLVVIPGFYLVKRIGSQRLAAYSSALCMLCCGLIAMLFHRDYFTILLLAISGLALALGSLRVVVNAEIMALQSAKDYHRRVARMLCNDTLGALLCPPVAMMMISQPTQLMTYVIPGSVPFFLSVGLGFALITFCKLQTAPMVGRGLISSTAPLNFVAMIKYRTVRSGFWMIFVFIGLEFTIPLFLGLLAQQSSFFSSSALLISSYWVLILVGRLATLQKNVSLPPTQWIYSCASVGIVLIILSAFFQNYAPLLLTCLGLCNANLYPAIFSQHSKSLPPSIHYIASGIFLMGLSGGAVVPLLQEYLATYIGLHGSFIIVFFCYLTLITMTHFTHEIAKLANDHQPQLELT